MGTAFGKYGLLPLGVALIAAAPAVAQEAQTPCTTKAECDARADARDLRARQEQWAAQIKAQEYYQEQSRLLSAQARAASENGKRSRTQDVMRRRRAAAAAAGD